MRRNPAPLMLLAGICLLGGCATVRSHWPFHRAAAAAPQPVHELDVQAPADAAMPVVLQFWERNTLVIDLQNVSGSGSVLLTRREGQGWPARLAFRMAPARFEVLEVRGAERVLLPVSAGAGTVTAELPPHAYNAGTGQLMVRWGASAGF